MGKSAPQAPAAPDYTGAAVAQGQANLTAAQQGAVLSNPNISSPLGGQSVNYQNIEGPNGQTYLQPNISQTLTPEAQKTLDAQQGVQYGLANLGQQALGTAGGFLSQQFNPQNINIQGSLGNSGTAQGGVTAPNLQNSPDLSGVASMPVNAGTTAQQAILSRLQPQIQQSNDALTQRLANQGITPGSEAYKRAQTQQGQTSNDLLTQAALQGINVDMAANQQGFNNQLASAQFGNNAALQGFGADLQNAGLYNSAVGQNFNQGLQSAQFGNQATAQNLAQQLQLYNQPLNQISALMSGSQIQMPQFQGYSGQNVQAAPIANATAQQGQFAQNQYAQQVAAYNSGQQGIAGLFGSALQAAPGLIALSDERLKSNIIRVGTHPLGVGIYEYDIFGRRERGVLAQEVEAVRPEAVLTHASGYKMVNYGGLDA